MKVKNRCVYIYIYIYTLYIYMKSSFAKTDNSVFNNSQKSCFFIVNSNESQSNCSWVILTRSKNNF